MPKTKQQRSIVYCDDRGLEPGGGFSAVMARLRISEFCLSGKVLVVSTEGDLSDRPQNISHLFLSQRFQSLHWMLRLMLLLIDIIRWRFRATIDLLETEGSHLHVWIGSDWTAVIRGAILAKLLRRSVLLYFVDGPRVNVLFGWERRLTDYVFGELIRAHLNNVVEIRCISDGLCDYAAQYLKFRAKLAHLPFWDLHEHLTQSTTRINKLELPKERQFGFVGGLSGVVWDFFEEVFEFCSEKRLAFKVHIFCSLVPHRLRERISKLERTGFLVLHTGLDDESVKNFVVNKKVIMIVPYSGSRKWERFVRYSFPSKLLKLEVLGLSYIAVAPSCSSLMQTHSHLIPVISNVEFFESLVTGRLPERLSKLQSRESNGLLRELHSFETYFISSTTA